LDPNLISKILATLRSQGQGPSQAASLSAPVPQAPGLEQAYSQPMAPAMQQAPTQSPMRFDQNLENQVAGQGGNNAPEPIIQALMKHLGMMSMIRNRSNQQMVQG
jgi:hypothetical protein